MLYYYLPFLVVQRINCINDAIKIKTTTLEFSNFRNQVPKFDKYAVSEDLWDILSICFAIRIFLTCAAVDTFLIGQLLPAPSLLPKLMHRSHIPSKGSHDLKTVCISMNAKTYQSLCDSVFCHHPLPLPSQRHQQYCDSPL
jgi:hypothetical protein